MVKSLSQMPADLARRVKGIDQAIARSKRDTLRAAAAAAKAEQLAVMAKDVGGDLRLSRVRSGKGARIGARYDIAADTATVKTLGPVPLIANDIPPHRIPRANGRRRRKRLAIPGVGVFSAVDHPGTKGKDTWNDGRRVAAVKVTLLVGKRTDASVIRAFRAGAR